MIEPRGPSLSWRLISVLIASTLLVWLGVSWLVHERLLHEVDEIYDAQLQQSGRVLAGILGAGAGKIELHALRTELLEAEFDGVQLHESVDRDIRQAGKYERVIGFQIVDRAGMLLLRSPAAPRVPFSTRTDDGFSDTEIGGVRWRVCSFHDDSLGKTVQVAEQYDVRQEISTYLLRSMRVPVLLGVAAVAVLIWFSVSWGLKPLSELARQVQNRRPEDDHPVELDSAPTEILPIINSLNRLLARVRDQFDAERRFTGDAAHELRTPIAGMKVQSQVALRATDRGEQTRALNGVLDAVDRASYLINQLLLISRLDWHPAPESADVVDLAEVVEGVAAQLIESAREKGITIAGDGDANAIVCADEALASTLVRNLLDNAIRYNGSGGTVRWSVIRQAPYVLLEITDSGPGIPADERQSVFERFHRLPGSRSGGAGLGLSIVRKIADLYRAEISFGDPVSGQGLCVSVRFPLSDAADRCMGNTTTTE